MWPVDRFVAVLDEFLARHPQMMVIAFGLNDIGLSNGKCRNRILACYKLPLSCAIALLGQCDAAVTAKSPNGIIDTADRARELGVKVHSHKKIKVL